MADPNISIVLNLHQEGRYVSRSIASLSEAAVYARTSGISTELVAVLDKADLATTRALADCDLRVFEKIKILEVKNGSLGLSRNDGCAAATGAYIATADADDLVSYNYFERMFLESQKRRPATIFVPKFVFAFGRDYHIAEYFDLDEITPLVLIKDHPYVSRIFSHRSLFASLRYSDAKASTGYAYEDWHFNCEAIAMGYDFRAVSETILFYRQRTDGLLNEAKANVSRQIAPSALFQPLNYLGLCRNYVDYFEDNADPRPAINKHKSRSALEDLACQELISAAQEIEPCVHIQHFRASSQWNYLQSDVKVGLAYARLCELVSDQTFDEVFLLPYLTTGGADQYILNIMHEFEAHMSGNRMLVLFGEPFDRYAWLDRLPSGSLHIDLCRMFPEIGIEDRDLLCFKLIEASAPYARLHIKSSTFAQRFFIRFSTVLKAHRSVFYRFSDGLNFYGDISLIEPSAFNFVSENLESLNLMICDNATIKECDQRRIGLFPDKWQILYAKLPSLPKPLPQQFRGASKSLLWASRLDREKRPHLIIRIANKMRRRIPNFTLDVWGNPTLDNFDTGQLIGLPNVKYCGAFSSFKELNAHEYFCYLYTSLFDGMPNILVEAAAACCPIIAPDLGGIAELVRDRETGILLPCTGDDEADAELYVQAVETLVNYPDLRRKVVTQAYELVCKRHDAALFGDNVKRVFQLATS